MWGTIPFGQRSQENAERQQRSVFIGNIPYTATEEDLRGIFERVGPISSLKYVMDRETGKPKGYAFCEYTDIAIAESAIRNLNNVELSGRILRVDSAVTQSGGAPGQVQGTAPGQRQQAMPMQQMVPPTNVPPPMTTAEDAFLKAAQQQAVQMTAEKPYGEPVDPDKAPEEVAQAVASLPPEQMFELMKQMKICIQNNPNEARNLLLQNPQLAYALLQAQVVMRILDPQVAMTMLHRDAGKQQPAMMPAPSAMPSTMPLIPTTEPMASYQPPTTQYDPRLMTRNIPGTSAPAAQTSQEDQERQALIKQVMELTDEQIALLPPEHRSSVLLLRQSLSQQQNF